MSKTITVPIDFYKQFEDVTNKLDTLIRENQRMRYSHEDEIKKLRYELTKELNDRQNELKLIIEEKNEIIQKLLNEIDRLKNKNNKNSTNSSMPSSTDMFKPKKSGANLYNSRKKTTKKIGGQKGHKGYGLTREKVEKLIKENKLETRILYHKSNNKSKKDVIKYRLGIEINAYVEKHIFKHVSNSKNKIPNEFYTDVTYDNSIKSLSIELGVYNVISYNRLSDFFKVISKGLITISNGTLVNFLKEFSKKATNTINNLKYNLLNEEIMYTDETSNNKWYIRNYSNPNTVVYMSYNRRGHKQIEVHDILTKYIGGLMHDHDTTMYKYGQSNYECLIHLGRYFEELIQNIPEITWAKEMKKLLFETYYQRKELISQNIHEFTTNQIQTIEQRYDELLLLAKTENKNISSSFYKEKSIKLMKRCKKYKENHLAYIHNFNVPFDNNLSERDLRIIKIKSKISGGFRNETGAKTYCDAISIIKTAIKRKINPYETISSIFNCKELFAC